jgi:hypothetical protein
MNASKLHSTKHLSFTASLFHEIFVKAIMFKMTWSCLEHMCFISYDLQTW